MQEPELSPWASIAQHFTALVTAVYLLSALAGTTYHFFLYRYFGLDVFAFWETGDYLASAVREPQILLFVIMAVMVASSVIWNSQWDSWSRRQGRLIHFLFGNYVWEKLGLRFTDHPVIGTLCGLGLFFMLSHSLAMSHAKAIARGERNQVQVQAPLLGGEDRTLSLISRSSAFVVFYDTQEGARFVIPLEALDGLRYPQPQPGSAPAAEANAAVSAEKPAAEAPAADAPEPPGKEGPAQ